MARLRLLALLTFLGCCGPFAPVSRAVTVSVESKATLGNSKRWTVFRDGGWVKIVKGRMQFYSSAGARRRTLSLRGNEFLVGPHGCRLVGVVAYADRQPKALRAVTFDLYDSGGKRLLRLNNPPFASAIVSPAGNAFVGIDGAEGLPRSVLRLYDAAGNLRDTLAVERFEGGSFTQDGSHFLFESAGAGLQVGSADGKVLKVIGQADRWATSADGQVIVTARGNRLLFYRDAQLFETLAWRDDRDPIRALAVSADGGYVAVISASHAAVVHIDSASVLWETVRGETQWNFRSVDLLDDAVLVAFGMDYDPGAEAADRHQRSRCLVFNRGGRLVHTEEDRPKKWGALYPQVRFDVSKGRLAFINRDRFKILTYDDLGH